MTRDVHPVLPLPRLRVTTSSRRWWRWRLASAPLAAVARHARGGAAGRSGCRRPRRCGPSRRPTTGRRCVERLGLQRLFSPPARMVLRNLERRPLKAALSSVRHRPGRRHPGPGQLHARTPSTTSCEFAVPRRPAAGHDADLRRAVRRRRRSTTSRTCPGVADGEPFRSVPVRLRVGHALAARRHPWACEPDASCYRLMDVQAPHGAAAARGPGAVGQAGRAARRRRRATRSRWRCWRASGRSARCRSPGWSTTSPARSAYMDRQAVEPADARGAETLSGAFLAVDPRPAGRRCTAS